MIMDTSKSTLLRFLESLSATKEGELSVFEEIADYLGIDPKKLSYVFWHVLRERYWKATKGTATRLSQNPDIINGITETRIASVKSKRGRRPRKVHQLAPYVKAIKVLREKGLSWREIAKYLDKYYKLKFDESTIRKFMRNRLNGEG